MARQLVEHDPVANDVGPEVFAAAERLIHLGQVVDDDVNDAADGRVALNPVLGFPPVVGGIGQLRMANNDEQIEVGQIAVVGLIDPVVAGVAAEQDDLPDLAALAPIRGAAGALAQRALELGQQGRADMRELLLLAFGKMIERGLHSVDSSRFLAGMRS